MIRSDTGRLLGLATKVLTQKAVERAHGGWIPEKERLKRQKEAEKQKKDIEKRPKKADGGEIEKKSDDQPYDLGQQLQRGAEILGGTAQAQYERYGEPIVTGIQELMRPIQEGGGPESYQTPEMVRHAMDVVGGLGAGSMLTGPSAAEANVLRSGMGPVAKEAVAQPQRSLSPMGFYSAAAERASSLQPKGDVAQMISALKNTQGLKTEELMNAGLIDAQGNVHPEWANRGTITREDLVSHLQGQMPQIEETVLGGKQPFDAKRLEQLQNEYTSLRQHPIDDPSFGEDKYDEMIRLMNIRDQSSTDSLYRAAEEAMKNGQKAQRRGDNAAAERYFREHELLNVRAEKLDLQGYGLANPTKYSQYALPGGENYREVLLKLPEQQKKLTEYPVIRPDGVTDGRYDSIQAAARRAMEINGTVGDPINTNTITGLRSPHWSDLNVLAHIRMADRKGPNGEKVLHVEEVQSDPGQKGRKEGFIGNLSKEAEELRSLNDKSWNGTLSENDKLRMQQLKDAGFDQELKSEKGKVPALPYITSTEGWTDLAIKRVLKEAAEGGYDKIVWTPGEEQALRYDLSKHIGELRYEPFEDEGKKFFQIEALNPQGKKVFEHEGLSENELESHFGKEVAQKILDDNGQYMKDRPLRDWRSLSGLDLKTGGEGMKDYYDNIFAKRLQKLSKVHDKNAKVGYTDIMLPPSKNRGTNNPPLAAPGIDVTPAMRESILKGQSAYQRGGYVQNLKNGGRVYPLSDREDWKKHQRDPDGEIVHMTPDEFLGKAQKLEDTKENKKDIKHWEKKIEKGKKMGPAALYTDGTQDGRHRVVAAKKAGIKKIPVLTWPKRGEEDVKDYMKSAHKIARSASKK